MIFLLQLLGSLVFSWGKHLTLELVEANSRSLALGKDPDLEDLDQDLDQDLDPGLREVALDHLNTLVMDTGEHI